MPAADRHYHTGRELVLRAHVYSSADIGRKLFDLYAILANRYAAETETPVAEYASDRHVTRIFDRYMPDGHQFEQPGYVAGELLRACADHDLSLCAYDAARLVEVFGYLFPKRRLTLPVCTDQKLLGRIVQDARHAPLPLYKVEGLRVVAERLASDL